MEVAATTIAAGAATVVEVGEARRVLVVAQDTAKGATRAEATGVAVAALEEAPKDGGTAHEVFQRGATHPPPPVRLRVRTQTTAR